MSDTAIVAIGLFLVSQFGASVWWASKTSTILREIERDIKDVRSQLLGGMARIEALERKIIAVETRCKLHHKGVENEHTDKTSELVRSQ